MGSEEFKAGDEAVINVQCRKELETFFKCQEKEKVWKTVE